MAKRRFAPPVCGAILGKALTSFGKRGNDQRSSSEKRSGGGGEKSTVKKKM